MRLIIAMVLALISKPVHPQITENPHEKALLYQITGNGLKRPSFVYGTMHVSNKLAFHLSDTFFKALRSCDVVGLETNPNEWFDKMLVSPYYQPGALFDGSESKINSINEDLIDIVTTNSTIARCMSSSPGIVNGFMYRYRDSRSDFEEDTYLDMYIYQAAMKLGKPVHSVENFEESEKLASLAEEAMEKGKRNYIRHKRALTGNQTYESVYRSGDLVMLDSLNKLMGYPEAWYEHMLYKRNQNMAMYMDNMMCSKSMFVGVGASHLPGTKGLINLLKEMRYTVKPIPHSNQNSSQKDLIDQMRVIIPGQLFVSPDSLFQVSVPGKMYMFPKEEYYQKYLCQDMANGAYYFITRLRTYASLFKQSYEYTLSRIDSLLYENIPGKIEQKKHITLNGYPGFDILNKNSRGNYQRHYVIVLPNEVIFFRMHGNGEYVKKHSQSFFKSIKINDLPRSTYFIEKEKHGFSARFPQLPTIHYEQSMVASISPVRKEWIATDPSGYSYMLCAINIHNTAFLEEDSFELELATHYFSEQLNRQIIDKHFQFENESCKVTCSLADQKDTAHACFVINRSRIYILYSDAPDALTFMNSFQTADIEYKDAITYQDTSLHYRVKTFNLPNRPSKYEKINEQSDSFESVFATRQFYDKISGDKVTLNIRKYNKYEDEDDSVTFRKSLIEKFTSSGDYRHTILEHTGTCEKQVIDLVISDTGCTRGIRYRTFITFDRIYTLSAVSDHNGACSDFTRMIFESFCPTLPYSTPSLFSDKSITFLVDITSKDSTTQAQAYSSMFLINLKKNKASELIKCIENLSNGPNYEEVKTGLIRKLALLNDHTVIPWLEKTYIQAEDSIDIKIAVLYVLNHFHTKQAYRTWVRLVSLQIPDLTTTEDASATLTGFSMKDTNTYIKLIMPTLLRLLHADEYKQPIYDLLAKLSDKKLIDHRAYQSSLDMITADARREYKKFSSGAHHYWYNSTNMNNLNKLLVPYYETSTIKKHFDQVLSIKNDDFKMNTICMMLRAGKPIQDSILYNLAAKPALRQQLYEKLRQDHLEHRFPKAFSQKDQRIEGMIYATIKTSSLVPDTIAILGKSEIIMKGKSYTVFCFKFKKHEDFVWQTGITGLCNTDSCTSLVISELSGVSKKYYSSTLNPQTFITDEIRTLRASRRGNKYRDYYYYPDFD